MKQVVDFLKNLMTGLLGLVALALIIGLICLVVIVLLGLVGLVFAGLVMAGDWAKWGILSAIGAWLISLYGAEIRNGWPKKEQPKPEGGK